MADTPELDGELPLRDGVTPRVPRRIGAVRAVPEPRATATVLPFPDRRNMIGESDLAALLADHARLRGLCDQLEDLADSLPVYPSWDERRTLADTIERATLSHVRATSSFLGRFFTGGQPRATRGILARILSRQISDALHAEDTADILRLRSLDQASIDMLSYMLRVLFEGARRALDVEGLFLLSLGHTRLTGTALARLERALV